MLTWIPNGDYTHPGALKDITNAWPTNRGYQPARDFDIYDDSVGVPIGSPNVVAPISGFSCIDNAGAYRGYISINGKIAKFGSITTSLSRTVGGVYSSTAAMVFTATADAAYATNGVDAIQKCPFLTATVFENIPTTCPVFRILVTLGTQLIGFNTSSSITYNGVSYAANGSRWWCSQAGAPDNFVPSVAANCATDILGDQDGPITAAIELNGYVVAFKRSAIYVGEFIGPPEVMRWRKVHSEFGCVGPFAVTKCDNRLYFMSPTNNGEICSFDGATVTPISFQTLGSLTLFGSLQSTQSDAGGPVSSGSSTLLDVCTATKDELVFFSRSYVNATFPQIIVYNTRTGRFGMSTYVVYTSNAPAVIWSGAENRSIAAVIRIASSNLASALFSSTNVRIAGFTQYRETYAGRKYNVSAGQSYFLGAIPSSTYVTINAEYPSATTVVFPQADGRYSFAPMSAARITQTITLPATDYEITRMELNVGDAGTNKSAAQGIIE